MEAIQYQALVGNDWLSKTNTILDWTIQELQLSQNSQHTCVLAIQAVKCLDGCPHNNNKIWQIALAKIEGVTPKEIKIIKNNPPESIELDWDPKPIINLLDPEQFYKHYQELAPTMKEQKQCLEHCTLELESVFNPDSNSDNNNDENTSFSSMQYGNKNINNSNSNSNPKIYIALPDLSKEQELK
ncbi:hypothetical protein G9A89_000905 [Geosiphon pyriformis]|nr:hypothetical protein G9A89_000905 [Geosiphon pyriformis]